MFPSGSLSSANSRPVNSTGVITPPPSPIIAATLPTPPPPPVIPATLPTETPRRRKGVLGGPIPKPRVINEIPEGWPGLAASRWATPKQQPTPESSSAPATPSTTTGSTTPATPAVLATQPPRRREGVLGGEIPKPKVINEIPEGWAGLAASRWATPNQQPSTEESASAQTTPSTTTTGSTTPATAPTPATSASPAPPSAQPPRRRKGVLGGEIPKPKVINEIPEGWAGLAASRWATPKEKSAVESAAESSGKPSGLAASR